MFYNEYIAKENAYYSQLKPFVPRNFTLNPIVLDDALNWLVQDSKSVLDFGSGSGLLAILCALQGAEFVLGIDLAEKGIELARQSAKSIPACTFCCGSVEKLQEQPDATFDGVILSNILDNMRPDDAMDAFYQSCRLLKHGGKLLLKLNPYLQQEQIKKWNIKTIQGDLLDDGMLLWNKKDLFWQDLLEKHFREVHLVNVYYNEYDKFERLFLCVK